MFEDVENQKTDKKQTQPSSLEKAEKKEQVSDSSSESSKEKEQGSVHTMPMEYYLGEKTKQAVKNGSALAPEKDIKTKSSQKGGGKGKKTWSTALLIVLGVVCLAAIGLIAYTYLVPADQAPEEEAESVVLNGETKEPEELPSEEQPVEEEETESEAEEEEGEDEIAGEDEDGEEEEPEEMEETEEPTVDPFEVKKFSLDLLSGLDSDRDGLTDDEEELLGTNPDMMDSDEDTYRDSEEVENMYSPLSSDSVRLWEMEAFSSFENQEYGYEILYPADWLVQPLSESEPDNLMISADKNEFINIAVYEKPSEVSLTDWYLEKAELDEDLTKSYTNYYDLEILESQDAFTAYVEKNNKVFAINYNIGLKEEAAYPKMFSLIVNSFHFVESEQAETEEDEEIEPTEEEEPAETESEEDEEEETPPPVNL